MSDEGRTPGQERDRKAEHIELALDPRAQLRPSAFDGIELEHQALPELDSNANAVAIQSIKLENEGWIRDVEVQEPTEPSFG